MPAGSGGCSIAGRGESGFAGSKLLVVELASLGGQAGCGGSGFAGSKLLVLDLALLVAVDLASLVGVKVASLGASW